MRSFALASGSAGNCFYFESEKKKVLVDVGLSFSKMSEKLEEKNLDVDLIDVIFITHEHLDHVKGFEMAFKNLKCDFYMSEGTFEALKLERDDRIKFVKNHDVLVFDDLKVFVVEKSHDAREAVSFVFESGGKKQGVFTDLGCVSDEIIHILKTLDVVYLEANYCEDFMKKSEKELNINYVNRLVSDKGHLSVGQCCDALKKFSFDGQRIILSHVSENTNSYANVYKCINEYLNKCDKNPILEVSFQNEATNWIN